MICSNCNHKISDDSKFCEFCGSRIEIPFVTTVSPTPAAEPAYIPDNEATYAPLSYMSPAPPVKPAPAPVAEPVIPEPVAEPVAAEPVIPAPVVAPPAEKPAGKTKFCRHCGAQIQTKKCPECGKKTTSGVPVGLFVASVLLLLLLVLGSLIGNGFQIFNYLDMKDEKLNLETNISGLQQNVSSKEGSISQLESQIVNLEGQLVALEEENSMLENMVQESQGKLNFFDTYAVIVNEGSEAYHTYDCNYVDFSLFWIYNIDFASSEGYYACPHCH